MFKNIKNCLDKDFRARIVLLEQMTHSVRQCLPSHLAAHCWVGGYERGIINLVVDDPACATLIHYRQKNLLDILNKTFNELPESRFKKATIRISHFPIVT